METYKIGYNVDPNRPGENLGVYIGQRITGYLGGRGSLFYVALRDVLPGYGVPTALLDVFKAVGIWVSGEVCSCPIKPGLYHL